MLVEESHVFCRGHLSGGKDPGAYLLWAACNDQFPTVKLEKVTLYYLEKQVLDLGLNDQENEERLCFLYPSLKKTFESSTIQDAYSAVINQVIDNTAPYKLTIKLQGTKVSNASKNKRLHQVLLSTVTHARFHGKLNPLKQKTGSLTFTFEKEYLRLLLTPSHLHHSRCDLRGLLTDLREWRMEFYRFIEDNSTVGKHKDARRRFMPDYTVVDKTGISVPLQRFRGILQQLVNSEPIFKSCVVNDKLKNGNFTNTDQNLFLIARSLFTDASRSNTGKSNYMALSPEWKYE